MNQSSTVRVPSESPFTPRHRTLLEALDRAAEQAADRRISLLYEGPEDATSSMTYAELAQRVAALAAGLSARGVAPSEPVLLVFETGFDLLVAFFACQRLRAIPVPTYPPAGLRIDVGLERVSQLALRAQTRLCLTSDTLAPIVRELSTRIAQQRAEPLRVATVSELSAAASLHAEFTPAQPDDIAFVQFTSGSTGRPKGVMLSHANLTANAHTIGLALQITPDDVFVNWCPLYHDMGLIGNVLSSLCWQLPLALFSPMAFIREPGRWLRAIHTYRGTISTAPNFAYWLVVARVNGRRREGLDLSSWRVACNGAEPVNAQTVEAFIQTYQPYGFRPEAMFPVYGLAEASLAVAFPRLGAKPCFDRVQRSLLTRGLAQPARAEENAACFVGVGHAVPGHEIRVVREGSTELVSERVVGEIEVRGPSVMLGYYDDREASAEALRGSWLRTGDLGYWADGQLFIVGRSKDVIIVRGQKVHPEDIERSLDVIDGVRTGNVVAFGVYDDEAAEDRVVVVAEQAPGAGEASDVAQRVRDTVMRDHGVSVRDVVFVARGVVPKTTSGKRQRALCRARYLAGALRHTDGAAPDDATP